MTKICIIGPSIKYFSGISAYTIRLANALSGPNSVSVLLIRNLLPRFLYPGKNAVDRQDHTMNFAPDIRVFEGMDWNSPLSWNRAYRFLKTEKPDVIIMQWWTSSVAHMELFMALANRMNTKALLILEMHEIVDPLEDRNVLIRLYSRIMGRAIMQRADMFVVHSGPVKEQAARIYHLKDDRIFVIPHGVYDSYFQAQSKEAARRELGISEKFVVLYFGLIRKYKGIPCLVEAFNRLPEGIAANSHLIVAGEDWGDEKELEPAIRASPYSKKITFEPRFVPESAISRYFSAADAVVLPYLRTSGSGVASLAMAYGKAIIVSDLDATRDSLREYKGANFVPCGDASVLAARIAEIYSRQTAGESLSFPVPRSQTWEQITGQYQKIIKRIKNT